MITKLNNKKQIFTSGWMVSVFLLSIFLTSCDYEFDLPEANSREDETPPSASFEAAASTIDGYLTYNFSNLSNNATDFVWDFGDGSSSTEFEPSHTYAESSTDEVGTPFTVSLTVMDKLNVTNTFSKEVIVFKPAVPPAIIPVILNGDFSEGADNWKIENEGNTFPFNTSSDGNPLNYDGSESGETKTPGAKYTGGTSAGPRTANTRNAYQAITVTPNTEYILEYSYAIKTDKDDREGGDRVIVEILGDWFASEDEVVASTDDPLAQGIGSEANGKGNFAISKTTFTSSDSGKIAIWIYAITNDELYVDNVKVYPAE